jgi:hypothetical protein
MRSLTKGRNKIDSVTAEGLSVLADLRLVLSRLIFSGHSWFDKALVRGAAVEAQARLMSNLGFHSRQSASFEASGLTFRPVDVGHVA